VNFTVNFNGSTPGSCSISGMSGGASDPSGSCSSLSVSVPLYNTAYSGTLNVTTSDFGTTGAAAVSFNPGLKSLTADASGAFGNCPGGPYCGPNSHSCTGTNFTVASCSNPVAGGTVVQAACQEVGTVIPSGTGNSSGIWIDIPAFGGSPWMNQMYFSGGSWSSSNSYLPSC
jgi:hypothetical protein